MEKFKRNISEALELPIDIVMNLPKIIIIGNNQVNISNHKGIIEYTNETIRINTSIGVVKISGFNMEIKNILIEEIMVEGVVEKIEIIG